MKQAPRKLRKHRKRKPASHRSFAEKRNRLNKEVREAKELTKR